MCDLPQNVSIRISAPGKVILHGEHSVVYGKLALAASLGLRSRLEFFETENGQDAISLEFPSIGLLHSYSLQDIHDLLNKPINLSKPPSDYNYTHPELIDQEAFIETINSFVKQKNSSHSLSSRQEQALTAFIYLFWAILGTIDVEIKPFKLKMDTDLTIGSGTGSSASFAVTVAAFLMQYIRIKNCNSKSHYKEFSLKVANLMEFDKADLELISRWAFQAERIIHGTPSGIDNTICTYGSMVEFHKGATPKIVGLTTKFSLILINTNVPRNTKTLVEKVASMRNKHRMIVDGILELMDETAVNALDYIRKINNRTGDEFEVLEYYETLGELTDINQNLLRCLKVSHPKLDAACEILSAKGFHGKLTGAGGGGFAICLVPPYIQKSVVAKVIAELNSNGLKAVLTDLGGNGVTID